MVPAAKDYKEAVTLGKCVTEFKPKCAASDAIEKVRDELLARLEARCGLVHDAPALPITERIGA